jgi:YD repeat-containing protein
MVLLGVVFQLLFNVLDGLLEILLIECPFDLDLVTSPIINECLILSLILLLSFIVTLGLTLDAQTNQGKDETFVYDGAGNKVEVKRALNEKDLKKAIKDIEKKLKDHTKKNHLSDEEMWELQDKLLEYKEQLKA